MTEARLWLGLMSGTSMDAVDAVLVHFGDKQLSIEGSLSLPYPEQLRSRLLNAIRNHADPDELGELDTLTGQHFARTANQLIDASGVERHTIQAIGSHGQTIRHQPTGNAPFSLQIGCPATIAEATGLTTVADFRRRDLAAGGQGAPLVPAFHQWLFRSNAQNRCILNLGGIANLTWLPSDSSQAVTGFDTGPANALVDAWCYDQTGKHYDENGQWASEGHIHEALLDDLQSDAYFVKPPPKSTGKERFNLDWINTHLQRFDEVPAEDVQRTLLQLAASSIASQLPDRSSDLTVYACGGGTLNPLLMKELSEQLQPATLATTAEIGLDPQWVEPVAFAWLARQTLAGLAGNLPAVTGARGERILGAVYPA